MNPLPKVLTLELPHATVTLPFRGVLWLATQVMRGIHARSFDALWVVGMENQAMDYLAARGHLATLTEWRAQAVEAAIKAGEWDLLNECPAARELDPQIEAASDEADRAWAPIQRMIDIAQAAVNRVDYDGAPS